MASNIDKKSSHEENPNLPRVGVCSWSLRPTALGHLIETLEQSGIDAIQLALTPLTQNPGHWADSFARFSDSGITVLSGMVETVGEDYSSLDSIRRTGGLVPDATWPDTLTQLLRAADVAAEGALELVTLHAGFIPHSLDDPKREVVLERLDKVASAFAQRGLRLALETGQETAATLLDALADPRLADIGVNFDPANMILYGMGDPVEGLEQLAERVLQVHVKDALTAATPGVWGSEVPVGSGAVDWPSFFAAVSRLPRRVNLLVEREAGDQRAKDISTALNFLEATFSSDGNTN
jgi:L-ribulose-5-phosphate 3-epimerase